MFSDSDIQRLANEKHVSFDKAKTSILNKVAVVSESSARQWYDTLLGLNQEPSEEVVVWRFYRRRYPFDLFFKAGYDYCHAKLLAASWKTDVYEAKSLIETKWRRIQIRQQWNRSVEKRVNKVTDANLTKTAFSAKDAVRLAKEWNIDLDKAKVALSDTYVSGVEKQVKAWLSR